MTLHGGNVDLVFGASAAAIAALYAVKLLDAKIALAWNVIGLLSLANIVVRAVLSSPAVSLVRTEVPNVALGSLPDAFIPTIIVPLALNYMSYRSVLCALRFMTMP